MLEAETLSEIKPLLEPLMEKKSLKESAKVETLWQRHQQTLLSVVLAIVPDTILGLLVQYSRDDPGARILTAFTFASILQQQVIEVLQTSLDNKMESMRSNLADPLKRRELWVLTQSAWIVYMSYLPVAAVICGYAAWRLRDAIWGQNADVTDVVASLVVVYLVSLPFSLGSSIMRSELETQKALFPLAVAAGVSWTIGLSFAYALGYWTSMGFVGIALTDTITYGIQFRMLVPETRMLTEWPGWHFREALNLTPTVARNPAMVGILVVNLSMVLFGFASLLASLIKVDVYIKEAHESIFPSLVMLATTPLIGICWWSSMKINSALDPKQSVRAAPLPLLKIVTGTLLATTVVSTLWLVGGLDVGAGSINPLIFDAATMSLSVLVPLLPPLGFMVAIRPVFRVCLEMWTSASLAFVVTFALGVILGAWFGDDLDGGIQGVWLGQYVCSSVFIVTAALSIERWKRALPTASSSTPAASIAPAGVA